jgi:CrcB protein
LVANRPGSTLKFWGTLFVSWATRHMNLHDNWRLFISTGFFGAYTTFSTYAIESIALAQAIGWIAALGNIIGTNLLCLIGMLIGVALAPRLWT